MGDLSELDIRHLLLEAAPKGNIMARKDPQYNPKLLFFGGGGCRENATNTRTHPKMGLENTAGWSGVAYFMEPARSGSMA